MPYYFYLARCSDNSLYAGSCKDVQQREAMHNKGKGAKYTRSRRPIRIIYAEKFSTLSDAMKREAHIKRWPKSKKEKLVQKKTINKCTIDLFPKKSPSNAGRRFIHNE